MLKIVFCLKRRADISREEFRRLWSGPHAELIRASAGVLGIRRNVHNYTVTTPLDDGIRKGRGLDLDDYDGVAESWFDSHEALRTAYSTDEGRAAARAIAEDEAGFVDFAKSRVFFVDERVVVGEEAGTPRGVTPILNVSDVEASIAWFGKVGWREGFVWPHREAGTATFGSVCTDKAEIFMCLGAQGSRGTVRPKFSGDDQTDGVWMSWWLQSPAEVDALHASALAQGLDVTYPPTDEPWGVREFHLRHPDGHMFRVSAGTGEG
jgi:uncharacterized glyoxalase superfamily protein PhnB